MVECFVNFPNLFAEQEIKRPNCVLTELASMLNMLPPPYHFMNSFTATVEINGASYTGTPADSQKEAANKAAFVAIWEIEPHHCEFMGNGKQSSQELSQKTKHHKRKRRTGTA